jgi:hypothetical protein
LDCVRLLHAHGASLGRKSLIEAVLEGHTPVAAWLAAQLGEADTRLVVSRLHAGNEDAGSNTLLMSAVLKDAQSAHLDWIVDHGDPQHPRQKNAAGFVPLHAAAYMHSLRMAQWLEARGGGGCCVACKTSTGQLPIQLAMVKMAEKREPGVMASGCAFMRWLIRRSLPSSFREVRHWMTDFLAVAPGADSEPVLAFAHRCLHDRRAFLAFRVCAARRGPLLEALDRRAFRHVREAIEAFLCPESVPCRKTCAAILTEVGQACASCGGFGPRVNLVPWPKAGERLAFCSSRCRRRGLRERRKKKEEAEH